MLLGLNGPAAPAAAAPPATALAGDARALDAAAAYGRAARAVHASPHLLARVLRAAPAADAADRRARVWAALGAYFGAPGRAAPPAPPG